MRNISLVFVCKFNATARQTEQLTVGIISSAYCLRRHRPHRRRGVSAESSANPPKGKERKGACRRNATTRQCSLIYVRRRIAYAVSRQVRNYSTHAISPACGLTGTEAHFFCARNNSVALQERTITYFSPIISVRTFDRFLFENENNHTRLQLPNNAYFTFYLPKGEMLTS